ncbi:hypothetical protein [Robbsia andropogonis]|nr:hypothetical protein [Robbsia andropogonis]MCP1117040.1 hypothetical protein [Robbsia andropogonis]MCP1128387.1 hypothetical protein [Robbsia andropogonis]
MSLHEAVAAWRGVLHHIARTAFFTTIRVLTACGEAVRCDVADTPLIDGVPAPRLESLD